MSDIYKLSGEIVSYAASRLYKQHMDEIVQYVNSQMEKLNEKHNLIGVNPLSMMYDNHYNHAHFMLNVFSLNDYDLLYNTLPWVFSSYESKGFKSSYFDFALNKWMEAVSVYIEPGDASGIIKVYEWILKVKPAMEEKMTNMDIQPPVSEDPEWGRIADEFMRLLLESNVKICLEYADCHITDHISLKKFYKYVVTSSLYRVGKLWQDGDISVAREHLITSMVVRVMSSLYMKFSLVDQNKGSIVVTSAVNEYREIGARILADVFELDGWDCHYLGANTPVEEVISFLKASRPFAIAISVTMSFNIDYAIRLVNAIYEEALLKDTRIIVGGLAFAFSKEMKQLGEAPVVNDVDEALTMMNEEWRLAYG